MAKEKKKHESYVQASLTNGSKFEVDLGHHPEAQMTSLEAVV